MCTILTIDRNFYNNNRELFAHRTKMDASINRDGFAITMLGETDKDVITIQMMDYATAMEFIDTNTSWQRVFLHTRAATTKTVNVFGCHNFKSTGNGKSTATDHWIIQHNGYLAGKEASKYLVDSMYLGDLINETGIDKTIQTIIETQAYSNIFFINPVSGEYRVARCYVNTLYTDGLGNYSTKIMGAVRQPVPIMESFVHKHVMKPSRTYDRWSDYQPRFFGRKTWRATPNVVSSESRRLSKSYQDEDWDAYVAASLMAEDKLGSYHEDPAEAYDRQTGRSSRMSEEPYYDEWSSSDAELVDEMITDEVTAFGDEAPLYQDDKHRFLLACKKLGFGDIRKVPNSVYSEFTQEQKKWFRQMKINKLA